MFNWFLQDKKEQPEIKFIPKIVINPKSNLYVEVQPKDPTTTSNIAITAFASPQVRSIIPVRVEWSRFKVKSDNKHSIQKIHCLVGNTYMCQPGDVGGYIQAVVRSVDETIRAEAQVTIGPIGIDTMIKRIIEGALYSGSLLSQVVVHQKERNCNINVRLNARTIEFTDEGNHQPLVKEYTMSEPKVQLNPKDPTRVYLRFEQDQSNTVRQWLNTIFNIKNASVDESSVSLKVPYSVHSSSSSSKMRLFQKSHGPCINKMELRFISRHSRDLFLFSQRAFVCKEDMKNSAILHRIQTLQNIVTQQDYFKFLSFMSLKIQIFRIADYAKQIQDDRNAKVKDLQAMQQSIGEMTLTYLKIIEEKGKNQKIDFEHSYSQISITRQQIMNRKNIRQLKTQNQNLKQRLREMNEEIELLKFFKKQDNQSMIFNQTSNPFAKKGQGHDQSMSYQGNSPQINKSHRSNMYEMSINYANLLEENRQLKIQVKTNKKNESKLDRSQNMMELLGSLDQRQEKQIKYTENQRITANLKIENEQLKRKIDELLLEQNNRARGISVIKPNKSLFFQQSHIVSNSILNQSSNSAVGQSYLNQSITSEAAFMKLQENLRSLSALNVKLQEDNTRLRRERDHYRNELMKSLNYIKQLESRRNDQINPDDSMMIRYKQENQTLQNERNSLLRKLQSLSRQNSQGLKEEFLQRQRKIKQLEQQIESYRIQNASLKISQVSPSKQDESDIFLNESVKLKKINGQLLEQIKALKIELEKRCGDNMYNSRVIELQNQLNYFRNTGEGITTNSELNTFLQQINELTKLNTKLKQENQDQQAKLETQTYTIEKLMAESIKSNSPKNPSLSSTSCKEKCYSERANQPSVEEIQKYKRQIKKLQEEIILMKRSADAINRSRDLSMDMDGYYEQKIDIMKREMDALYAQNENLSKMCERYGKDAREASKQLNKWREKATSLMRLKTEENSLISN